MRTILMLSFFMMTSMFLNAQDTGNVGAFTRKGFTFGISGGGGVLSLTTDDKTRTSFAFTLPNFRLGYMIHNRLAIQVLQPGSPYRYNGTDRVFEGFLLSTQYWVLDRIWIQGGAGMTFDASAFWTLPELEDPEFNVGFPAFSIATGYEIKRWRSYTLDVQYRFYYGKASLEDGGTRSGLSNMLSFGLNLY